MTIINTSDLDNQMGRHIDPNSVPKHDGTGTGHMQAIVQRGSEQVTQEQGAGRYGAPMFSESEVGKQDFFGSQTIISVNDAPPLMEQMDPLKKFVVPPMPVKVPVPVVAAKPAVPGKPRTAAELLASMGLGKKP